MSLKTQLLEHILSFCKSKHRNWFTKEELFVYIWHRDRSVKIESVLRELRRLVRDGFLVRQEVYNGEKTVVYYAIISRIRSYLISQKSRRLSDYLRQPPQQPLAQ